MTPKQRINYLESKGNYCPYCESEDIEAGHFDFDGNRCRQNVVCNDRRREWTDIYKLVDVEEIQE